MTTKIEWTEQTWNPVTGCDRLSSGCDHCYALTMAKRLKGMGSAKYQRDGDPKTSGPGFGVSVHEDTLTLPFSWRKPRKVFVNSMSDLFHAEVPDEFIAEVFSVMARTPQHTYQVLTKRHARMRSLMNRPSFRDNLAMWGRPWPLPNVWLGVSVEDQHWADIRIPALLGTPAAVRFISAEPLLGPIDLYGTLVDGHRPNLTYWLSGRPHWATDGTLAVGPHLDWVITGGESGRGARSIDQIWVRSIRDQCQGSGVAFLFKQWGGRTPKANGRLLDGRTWDEYPA